LTKQDEIVEELKKIRELLTPKPAPPPPPPKTGLLNEFKDFISKYKVMGMAVAFILGLYLGTLVKALVDDLIMPIVRIGHFIGALITFLIVAFVIFVLVKATKKAGIE
jgi:large conductance mechanosensitive channel